MSTRTTIELTLGERLRKAREDAKLSKLDLADELEVHRNTITNYETGRQRPPRWLVWAWAQLTDYDPALLAGNDLPRRRGDSTSTRWYTEGTHYPGRRSRQRARRRTTHSGPGSLWSPVVYGG